MLGVPCGVGFDEWECRWDRDAEGEAAGQRGRDPAGAGAVRGLQPRGFGLGCGFAAPGRAEVGDRHRVGIAVLVGVRVWRVVLAGCGGVVLARCGGVRLARCGGVGGTVGVGVARGIAEEGGVGDDQVQFDGDLDDVNTSGDAGECFADFGLAASFVGASARGAGGTQRGVHSDGFGGGRGDRQAGEFEGDRADGDVGFARGGGDASFLGFFVDALAVAAGGLFGLGDGHAGEAGCEFVVEPGELVVGEVVCHAGNDAGVVFADLPVREEGVDSRQRADLHPPLGQAPGHRGRRTAVGEGELSDGRALLGAQ